MLQILSSLFLCLSLGFIPVAQAGLFDAIKSVVPGSGLSQPVEPSASAASKAEQPAENADKKADAKDAKPNGGEADNFDLKADPATLAEKFVEVENADKLGGITRVMIPSFMVEYVTEAKADTPIDGIAMISGAPSNAVVKLKGTDAAKFQALTDTLYEQTVAELGKAGIEVVALDKLKESATYKEIAAKGEKAPREEEAKGGKGMYHSAKELPLYYMDEVNFIPKFEIKLFSKPKEDVFLTFGTKFGAGFSTAQIPQLEEKLAKEFDAAVMKVRITFLAGGVQVDHSFWTGNTVSVKGAGAFAPMVSRYAFIKGNGDKARLSLKESVLTNGLGELVNTTSSLSKAGDIARNSLTIASRLAPALSGGRIGGGMDLGYGNSADYEWRVEPGAFEKTIADYYPGIARMFVAKMRAPCNRAASPPMAPACT